MKKIGFFLALGFVAACSSAGSEEDASGSEEALRRPGVEVERPERPTRPPPGMCQRINPTCEKTRLPSNPELEAAGCSETYHYLTGANAGLLGGIVSYCKLGPAFDAYKATRWGDVRTNLCDACLKTPAPGYAWVMWQAFIGPNCASGCRYQRAW